MENINILNKNINRAREIIKNKDIMNERVTYILRKLLKLCNHYLKEIILDPTHEDYGEIDENCYEAILNIGKSLHSTKKYLNNSTLGPKYKARQFLKTAEYIQLYINKYIVF